MFCVEFYFLLKNIEPLLSELRRRRFIERKNRYPISQSHLLFLWGYNIAGVNASEHYFVT